MKQSSKGAESKKLWEVYFSAMKDESWQKALSCLNDIMRLEPENPNVSMKIGDLLQRTGKTSEAASAYHKAAWLLTNAGFKQKAIAVFKLILRIDPNDSEAITKTNQLLMDVESKKDFPEFGAPESTAPAEAGQEPAWRPSAPEEHPPASPEASGFEGGGFETQISGEEVVSDLQFPQVGDEEAPQSLTSAGEWDASAIPAIFAPLSKETTHKILSLAEHKIYPAGAAVIEEGDIGDSMYVIRKGRAKVIAHILGRTIELATLSEGDVFGEVGFLTGRPRTANVIADTELEAVEIGRPLLDEMIEKNPQVLERLQDFFHTRVQETIKKVKKKK